MGIGDQGRFEKLIYEPQPVLPSHIILRNQTEKKVENQMAT